MKAPTKGNIGYKGQTKASPSVPSTKSKNSSVASTIDSKLQKPSTPTKSVGPANSIKLGNF